MTEYAATNFRIGKRRQKKDAEVLLILVPILSPIASSSGETDQESCGWIQIALPQRSVGQNLHRNEETDFMTFFVAKEAGRVGTLNEMQGTTTDLRYCP